MSAPQQPQLAPVPDDPGVVERAAAVGLPGVPPLNLLRKLAEIFAEVREVEADANGPAGQFRYPSINAVYGVLRQPLAERGVLVVPEAGDPTERAYTTSKGNDRIATYVPSTFTFIDAETGEQLGPIGWLGGGQDDAEKGSTKALTNAERTFLLAFFQLIQRNPAVSEPRTGARSTPAKLSTHERKRIVELSTGKLTGRAFLDILRSARGLEIIDVPEDVALKTINEHLDVLTAGQATTIIEQLQKQIAPAASPAEGKS